MRIACIITVLLLLTAVDAGAQGTLHDDIIFSQSLGLDSSIGIYLPEGYDPVCDVRYPVVYFLHGALNGYPGYWTNFQMKTSLDNLIGSGQIEPHSGHPGWPDRSICWELLDQLRALWCL